MPFFTFSIKDTLVVLNDFNIKPNEVYFSKNTYIWKILNKQRKENLVFLKKEKRKKILKMDKSVLFCLPPSIGMGDAIEYARALKSIEENKLFKDFGIAFTANYSFIFQKYFKLKKLYPYLVSEKTINKYSSLFHFTLEIEALKNQKYIRSNIEEEIKKYFNIHNKNNYSFQKKTNNKIKKISIFPISNSPIRTMPIYILNKIIRYLKDYFIVEVYLDKTSDISNFLLNDIYMDNVYIVDCKNKLELVNSIKKIDYGIFMDSGPLHIAKLFNKRGALIESSVSSKILLSNYSQIIPLNNNFFSKYCKSPCGLTDLFNYKGKTGCYNSLEISNLEFKKNNLFPFMGRRGVKNDYTSFIKKPVGCLQSISIQHVLNLIKEDLAL